LGPCRSSFRFAFPARHTGSLRLLDRDWDCGFDAASVERAPSCLAGVVYRPPSGTCGRTLVLASTDRGRDRGVRTRENRGSATVGTVVRQGLTSRDRKNGRQGRDGEPPRDGRGERGLKPELTERTGDCFMVNLLLHFDSFSLVVAPNLGRNRRTSAKLVR